MFCKICEAADWGTWILHSNLRLLTPTIGRTSNRMNRPAHITEAAVINQAALARSACEEAKGTMKDHMCIVRRSTEYIALPIDVSTILLSRNYLLPPFSSLVEYTSPFVQILLFNYLTSIAHTAANRFQLLNELPEPGVRIPQKSKDLHTTKGNEMESTTLGAKASMTANVPMACHHTHAPLNRACIIYPM